MNGKNKSGNGGESLSVNVSTGKGRSTLHGNSYHLRLGMVILLRAFRMYQEDCDFVFEVDLENPDAKDFDDLIYRYQSPRLPSGIVNIQAKHKRTEHDKYSIITEKMLLTPLDAFSLAKYFLSFLEVDQQCKTHCNTYALCTNASLDKSLQERLLIERNHMDVGLQFCYDIEATCYQISCNEADKQWKERLLGNCAQHIGKLMAKHVFVKTAIPFQDSLYHTFATLINECVQPSVPKNNTSYNSDFKFKEGFINGPKSSPIEKLSTGFIEKYKKLAKNDHLDVTEVMKTAVIKINRIDFENALSEKDSFKKKLEKFYKSFVLICNSLNDEKLYRKTRDLLPTWCNSAVALDRLHTLLFDAIKDSKCITNSIVEQMFMETNADSSNNCAQLERLSNHYLESLRMKYPYIEVCSERLTSSTFVAFLKNTGSDVVYEFTSQLDLTVSSLIVAQVLSLEMFQWETLFVDTAKYDKHKDLMDILHELLMYLRDVNHPTIKVITILGKPNHTSIDEIKELSERYDRKIVIVQKIAENQPEGKHLQRFFIQDLTLEASRQLFTANQQRMILGTVLPLRRIVDQSDDLCFLLALLERCDQSNATNDNLNECNYEQIKQWYVHRHYEPKNDATLKENVAHHINRNRSALPYTKCEHVPFKEIAKFIDDKISILPEVQRVLNKNEEDPMPPGFPLYSEREKVFIFLNDAGHGKTSYLTWLAWRLGKLDDALYVIKLNAMEYTSDFERLENKGIRNVDDTGIVRLLYRLVHLALFVPSVLRRTMQETDVQRNVADQCAEMLTFSNGQIDLDKTTTKHLTTEQLIELRLFRAKFNERQLVLILDGFDEIAPYYKDVVMQCFARFANFERIRKIYVSSRPGDYEKDFRNTFNNCRIIYLKLFSRDDIILSLHKCLLEHVDDYKHCEKDQCGYLLTVLYVICTEILDNLTTIPLLLCLAQDKLLHVIKKHVHFKEYTISKQVLTNAKLDTMELVEHFIDRKLHILNTEKSGTTDSALKTPVAKIKEERSNKHAKERHMLLAMCVIFDKKDREKLLSMQEQDSVTEFIGDVIAGVEKTGLIEGMSDGVPQFVHRIFAEYFAACWLNKNRKRFRNESVFRSQVIWTHSLKNMRDFFNRLILRESEGCDLHWAVLNESSERIRTILYESPSAVDVKDNAGRLPLHFARSFFLYFFEQELSVSKLSDLANQTDDLFQWNALEYAFILNDGLAIERFLKWGVRFDEEILFQQLDSNDVDNLFFQGNNYAFYLESYGKQFDAANEMRARLVKYLISDRKMDIYSPRQKMEALSVLEFCAAWNQSEVFHQLITQSGPPAQVLDGLVDRLFELAFERKSHDVINYLVDRCHFPLPSIHDNRGLVEGGIRAIEQSKMKLFNMIFQQLCIRYKIEYAEENAIIDEADVQKTNDTIEYNNWFENECCVLSRQNVNLSLPDWSLEDDCQSSVNEIAVERLLTRSIHVGSVQIASYILQKTKMAVTNRLIVTIMRLLPKSQPFCHEKSMPAFMYLLRKTVDLHSVDQEGRNLFHMIAQNGCFYMLPCLIAMGFDPKQINARNHWNGFHYLASCTDMFGLRAAKAFAFLFQHLGHVDGFAILSSTGENVFDIAITSTNFVAAQMLVQAEYYNLSDSGKVDTVIHIIQQMMSKYGAEFSLNFLQSLHMNSYYMELTRDPQWYAVYASIVKQVPVL